MNPLPTITSAIRQLAAAVDALAVNVAEKNGSHEGLDEVAARLAEVARLVGQED